MINSVTQVSLGNEYYPTKKVKHLLTAEIGIRIGSGIVHIELKSTCIITLVPITTEIATIPTIQITVICEKVFLCSLFMIKDKLR